MLSVRMQFSPPYFVTAECENSLITVHYVISYLRKQERKLKTQFNLDGKQIFAFITSIDTQIDTQKRDK